MRKRNYTRLLAGFLCAAVLSADLMSTGLFSAAAEATDISGTETQAEESADAQKEVSEVFSSVSETGAVIESAQMQSSEMAEKDVEAEAERSLQEETVSETTENAETNTENLTQVEGTSEKAETPETKMTETADSSESETPETEMQVVLDADGNIASGVIDEDYGHITWVIDADGQLTVAGTGDFAESEYSYAARAPWFTYREAIKSAKINVVNTLDASYMFHECENMTNIDLNNFDTSKVVDMSGMFSHCSSLSSLNLNNFDTSNVVNMSSMFDECTSLITLNLENFDTSNVTNMSSMFWKCTSLSSLKLSNFNTSKVISMVNMFGYCRLLSDLNLNNFDTSNVVNMADMFWRCSSLSNLVIDNFNTSKTEYMNNMFGSCKSLKSLDLNNFNTSNVVSMNNMFGGCTLLSDLNIGNFNTSNVTDMRGMFGGCSSLSNLNLKNFDTSNVTSMVGIFEECSSLGNLNLENFDTSNVIDMSLMFAYCNSLYSLDLSNFNTSNVTNMRSMFLGCTSLKHLNLSNFDTSKVINMGEYDEGLGGIFANCTSLTSLDLSNFNISSTTDVKNILLNCTNLLTLYTPYNVKLSINLPTATPTDKWYRSDGTVITELPQNLNYSIVLGKNYVPQGNEPEQTFTVTFDTQDGEVIAPVTGLTAGSTITLPTGITKGGYLFDGWYTQPEGGDKIEGSTYTVTQNITLYAHWILADDDNENPGDGLWISGVNKAGYTYTGDKIIPTVTVWDKTAPLTEKTDYTIAYKNNTNAGKATITVTGKGNYSGKETFTFDITPANMESDVYADTFYVKINAKKAQKPVPELYYMGTKLKNNKDFTISYSNKLGIYAKKGEYTVTLTGKNNFTGKKTLTLTAVNQIPKKPSVNITKATLTGFEKSFTYTGKECRQTCTLTMQTSNGKKELAEGVDYTVRYTNNIKAGTAAVIYYGKNGYAGKLKKTYKILPYDIAADSAKKLSYVKKIQCFYAKGGAKPKPVITFDGKALREGADYTLSYQNNKTIGTSSSPCVTVNGKGSFKGKIAINFTIKPQDLSKMTLVSCDKVYSGKAGAHRITPKLMDLDGKLLSAGKDFDKSSITYAYDKDTKLANGTLKKAGAPVADTDILPADTQIRITLKHGSGNGYTGTFKGTFRIIKADIKSARIEIPTQTYTGDTITPDKKQIKVTLAGKKLRDEDYDIVLCTDNVQKGKASITLKGMGNYGGTKTVKFTIGAKGFLWWWRKNNK